MLYALKTEQETLDLDLACSRCPLLSPFYQAPVVHGLASQTSASQLPGQLSHHRTGWHRARHRGGPGITGRGSTRCHTWSTDLHPWLGLLGVGPTLLHSPGQAASPPRGAEGVTQTHTWKATSRGSVSQQTWPLWTAQEATTPTITEAMQGDAHFLALDPARLCSHSGSLSGHASLARHRSSLSL